MSEKITIEVDSNNSLARHIEDLQRVITNRNKQIEQLTAKLEGEGESEFIQRLNQKAYSAGYKAAARSLGTMAVKFETILKNVSEKAFAIYIDGDKIGWDKSKYDEVSSERSEN